MTFKPDSYTSVSPYLIVNGADRTIQFLIETFGASELRRMNDGNGGIMHAEVRVDDSVIMLSDQKPGWPVVGAHVHVYAADPQAVYRRALAAGGQSIQEPIPEDENRSGVRDPGGTTWWIAGLAE
jgi:uncharacterized glyoxalase superfamily protein PhnB